MKYCIFQKYINKSLAINCYRWCSTKSLDLSAGVISSVRGPTHFFIAHLLAVSYMTHSFKILWIQSPNRLEDLRVEIW